MHRRQQHLYSITVRPSALAALRLMANSNLVEARQAGQRRSRRFVQGIARLLLHRVPVRQLSPAPPRGPFFVGRRIVLHFARSRPQNPVAQTGPGPS
jgi:hypothetical protein